MSEQMPRSRTAVALAVIAIVLVVLCDACGAGGPSLQPVLSEYETATGHVIVRDCGYSAPVPGKARQSLWLFCDTVVTTRHGKEIGNPIHGTGTAAEGSYTTGRAPSALAEVVTPEQLPSSPVPSQAIPAPPAIPSDTGTPPSAVPSTTAPSTARPSPARTGPQPFLPAPTNLTLPASALPCAGPRVYPARWTSGVAREPTSSGHAGHLLISYDDYCVSGDNGFTPEAFGLLDYDPESNVLGSPAEVFGTAPGQQLPPQWQLGSPIFHDGYLYLFSSCAPRRGCGTAGVFLVRTSASPAAWQDGYTYQYWTGKSWSSSPVSGAPLFHHAKPLAVSAGDFSADGHGLIVIEQTSLAGDFSVWQSAAPTGPWQRIETDRVPCTAGKQAGASALCRALIGHPELSSRSELLISFFDPGDNHIEVSSYPW